jgi:electron transport complex protein RnfB
LAIAIMTGLCAFFGVGLAVAHKFLRVEEDPRLEVLEEMLPGSNCGACGEAGCRAFAEKLIDGVHKPSRCTVSSPDAVESIAAVLGVEAGKEEKRLARLHCAGGLGLGDCMKACTFHAIHMNDRRLPVVDMAKCTACGDCVQACPRDLFEIMPLSHALIVQCSAPMEGEEARAVCQVACDACGRCAQDAPTGLIHMDNNLPVVDYAAGGPASPRAVLRCPTGAIRWVQGRQFAPSRSVSLTGVGLD